MSKRQLLVSLRLWTRRHAYRQRRLDRAHAANDAKRIEHWHGSLEEAGAMMNRRRKQLAELRPLRLRAYDVAEGLVGVMEQGSNNAGPMVSKIIRANGGIGPEPWCLAAGTLVSTPEGLMPIERLRSLDRVTTGNGDDVAITVLPARTAQTVKLRAFGVADSIASVDHPYLVRHRLGDRMCEPRWVAADKIRCGDYVLLAEPSRGTEPFNPASAYVFGRWLADGWTVIKTQRVVQRHRAAYVCCSHAETTDLRDRLVEAGVCGAERRYPTVTQFALPVRALPFWEAGGSARTKRIPGLAMTWNQEARQALLRGYLDGDGHEYAPGCFAATTVSRSLAYGVAQLARSLDMGAAVHAYDRDTTATIAGRKVNQEAVRYDVRIRPTAPCVRDGWTPVRSVVAAGERQVFNVTVLGDDPTFVADGVVVHNCGDFVAYAYRLAGSKAVTRAWASVRLLGLLAGVRRLLGPSTGDVVRFRFDHVGLFVRDLGDGTIETLEGNTGSSGAVSDSITGGDGVYRKIRSKTLVGDYLRITR